MPRGNPTPIMARVLPKVDKTSDPNGCWLWTGARNGGSKGGYGLVWSHNTYEDGKRHQVFRRVHIVVWEHYNGPVPEGHVLDHVWRRGCRNRHCCNPEHLEPVTQLVNIQRTGEKNQRYCPKWHERTDENTERLFSGWLRCLTCKEETRQRQLERGRQKRKEARERREAEVRRSGQLPLPEVA